MPFLHSVIGPVSFSKLPSPPYPKLVLSSTNLKPHNVGPYTDGTQKSPNCSGLGLGGAGSNGGGCSIRNGWGITDQIFLFITILDNKVLNSFCV